MSKPRERILLKNGLDRNIVDRLMFGLPEFVFVTLRKPSDGFPFRVAVYRGRKGHDQIEYVEDFVLRLGYLIVTGANVPALAARIRERVKSIGKDELILNDWAAAGVENRIARLHEAAIIASVDVDSTLLALFNSAFVDPEPRVRRAAVLATGYVEWPELKAHLARLAEKDPDPETKRDATEMIEAMRASS